MSSIEINMFSGAFVFPSSILINAKGQNVGEIISEPQDGCFVIRTKDLETFAYARKLARLLYYSQMLKPRCACSKLTHGIPTIELNDYREFFFLLRKSHSIEQINATFDSVEDIEVQILEKFREIEELRHMIKSFAYELFL